MTAPEDHEALRAVLAEAARRGMLGPALDDHLAHSAAIGELIEAHHRGPPARLLDLGSGGGVPGLVLATRWPTTEVVLLDAQARRARHLGTAVTTLRLEAVGVLHGRAELFAHQPELRERFDAVTARGFGPPPVTAECGAGFLALGGTMLVSEPPDAPPDRWNDAVLAELGLELTGRCVTPIAAVVLTKRHPTPARFPRPPGRPSKRHLW